MNFYEEDEEEEVNSSSKIIQKEKSFENRLKLMEYNSKRTQAVPLKCSSMPKNQRSFHKLVTSTLCDHSMNSFLYKSERGPVSLKSKSRSSSRNKNKIKKLAENKEFTMDDFYKMKKMEKEKKDFFISVKQDKIKFTKERKDTIKKNNKKNKKFYSVIKKERTEKDFNEKHKVKLMYKNNLQNIFEKVSSSLIEDDKLSNLIILPNIKKEYKNVYSRLFFNLKPRVQQNNSIINNNLSQILKGNYSKTIDNQEDNNLNNKKIPFSFPKQKIKPLNLNASSEKRIIKNQKIAISSYSCGPITSKPNTNKLINSNTKQKELKKVMKLSASFYQSQDSKGETPLHKYVHKNQYYLCKYILEKSAITINYQNKQGNTPLHYAVSNNNLQIVKLLLEYGADVNIKNKQEISPFNLSADKRYKEIYKILHRVKYPDVYIEKKQS